MESSDRPQIKELIAPDKEQKGLCLGAESAEILKGFVGQPLPEDLPRIDRWKRLFHQRVKACIEGKPFGKLSDARSYISHLHQMSIAASLDAEKSQLLSAAWIYALENRSKFLDCGKNRQSTFVGEALHLSTRRDFLGTALKNCLSHITLKELVDTIKQAHPRTLTSALPGLSEQALTMRRSEDPGSAEQIIELAISHIFSASLFHHYAWQFSPNVIEEILQHLHIKHPEQYYAFSQYVVQTLQESGESAFPRELLTNSPRFQECIRHGREQTSVGQGKMEWVDQCINYFEQAKVEVMSFWYPSWIESMITGEGAPLHNTKVNITICHSGSQMSWSGNDFRSNFGALIQDSSIPEAKREKLRAMLEQVESKISIMAGRQKAVMQHEFEQRLRIKDIQSCNLQDLKRRDTRALNNIENVKRTVTDPLFPLFLSLLDEMAAFIREQLSEIASEEAIRRSEYERQRQRDAEIQAAKVERLKEMPKDYLRDLTERQMEYLRELYSEHTGLQLDGTASHADSTSDGSIGSVVSGGGGGVDLKQRLLLRPYLLIEQRMEEALGIEGIHLETGETLEEIGEKRKMVDWVAPHEIAHMVDQKLGNVSEQLVLKHQKAIDRIAAAAHRPITETKKLVVHSLQECVIDGLGYGMLVYYGTADLFDKTGQQRISKAITGFLAAMEVVENNMVAQTEEAIVKHPPHFMVLRMFAVARILASAAKKDHVPDELSTRLAATIGRLESLYIGLHSKHPMISKTHIMQFLRLCKECFMKADTISFESAREGEPTELPTTRLKKFCA